MMDPTTMDMDILTERTSNILLADDDDDDDDNNMEAIPRKERRMTKSKSHHRRRRRSSARFLHLDGDNNNGEDGLNMTRASTTSTSTENIGEVYQRAIRMNAENRINASNSWNLSLIDHMDRFLMPQSSSDNSAVMPLEDTLGPITGVNFTKASCTLDASVKIYSYRVDDVHLTSYKVLANLNRSDNGKKSKAINNNENINNDDDDSEAAKETRTERRKATEPTETLEANLANINIHKLDAAFDIDPLFHKMSKTFDEGGAKGLLLANLGVSETGCNIVFDSTLDDEETKQEVEEDQPSNDAIPVDVTSLTANLISVLNGQSVHQMQLVPQLASLRSDFAQLHEEGFVEKITTRSKRYAAPQEEEKEADRSIHVEAIERSRASQADLGRSLIEVEKDDNSSFGDDDGGYAPADFGGGEDANDDFVDSFIHDGDHRFSSASFQTTFEAAQPPSQATVLLDAIAAGNISGSQSNYEYFNRKALESIQGNQWAGAAHWKKIQPKRKPRANVTDGEESQAKTQSVNKKKNRRGRGKAKTPILIDISQTIDLKELLRKPPKGKKGSNPLQMTKAAIAKASKNENLLPLDAGLKVESLGSLFLRPNTNVLDFMNAKAAPTRTVGFSGVDTWGRADDGSFGDDNEGLGYDFGGGGDDDDHEDYQKNAGEFVVPELEGIRKVEKVRVGYATVAKQVDVKRLKKDLWIELERTLQIRRERDRNDKIDDAATEEETKEEIGDLITEEDDDMDTKEEEGGGRLAKGPLSFQDTVREMQSNESQADVTLPFYFICILHLANEKGLALESTGLEDFIIHSS